MSRHAPILTRSNSGPIRIGYAISLIMYRLSFNNRSFAATTLAAVLLLSGACRGKHSRPTVENEEPQAAAVAPAMASTLKMSDAAAAQQLIRGFHGLESGAWRWTAKSFTVLLRPPVASAQRGATLNFNFVIPDVVIQKLSGVTLSATVGQTKLKSETFSKPGNYTFSADIAPELLVKDALTFDFTLDKAIAPSSADVRELGIIATGVGLESK